MPQERNRNRTGRNDPRFAPPALGTTARTQQISDPTDENLVTVATQLKEAVETIVGERGSFENQAVTFQDLINLGLINIKESGDIQNNIPFTRATENSKGVLKYCDGEHEDFGAGEGWYVQQSDGWYKLALTGPYT